MAQESKKSRGSKRAGSAHSIYSARRDTAQAGAGGHVPSEAARMAYEAARAMMTERDKYKAG